MPKERGKTPLLSFHAGGRLWVVRAHIRSSRGTLVRRLGRLEPTFPELSLPLEDEALPELRALPEPPPELTWEEPEPE
jgi:hypothetical protein